MRGGGRADVRAGAPGRGGKAQSAVRRVPGEGGAEVSPYEGGSVLTAVRCFIYDINMLFSGWWGWGGTPPSPRFN